MHLASSTFILWALSAAPGILAEAKPTAQIGSSKISLQSRKSTKGSLARRALPAKSLPLKDQFLGTDLQWYGDIQVGTPPQPIPVVFDTGSGGLEFTSTLCGQACANQVRFDVNKSSTFVDGVEESTISFSTGGGVNPAVNNSYTLWMRRGQDTVSFNGLKADNVSLNLIVNQTAGFAPDPYSGIMGMDARGNGFWSKLFAQGLPQLWSFYLTPKSVGNAELTLGGIDDTKHTGPILYSPLTRGSGSSWSIAASKIIVNGKTSTVLQQPLSFLMDTGTSNIVFRQDITEAIYANISPDIKPNLDEPGTYGIPCDRLSSLPASITFEMNPVSTPYNLTIPSRELSVGPFPNNANLCQTLINADDSNVIGGSLLKYYYSVWDLENRQIGFAPAAGVPT